MPTSSSGLPQSYDVNPSASGSSAPSRPGKNRKNPLYFLIDKEVTVASRVVWIASSARAHQGPATIPATARTARARTERTDRISNLRNACSWPRCAADKVLRSRRYVYELPELLPSRLPPELPTFRTLCFDGIGGQGRSKKRAFVFTAVQLGSSCAAGGTTHNVN